MCGIAGYKVSNSKAPERELLGKMLSAIRHRGPDGEGFYFSGAYAGGMRRLSINDLEGGSQPLFNTDKSVALLYNGEIYNSPELRKDLEAKGYKFRTKSDGEVVCHLYDEYGEDLFEKLDGMFAIALWIEKERKLILARDIPGEKPLYYYQINDKDLVFASEIKSLTLFPDINLDLDPQSLWDFPTFLWVPQPNTIYRRVKALPRSHLLVADEGGIKIRPYRNKFNQQPVKLDDKAVIAETRRVVSEAVKSRLLSDVPVGAFLSGGLDSSIVAALAAKELPSLSTFTIGFEDLSDPYHGYSNEAPYAEAFAKKLGAKHTTIKVAAKDFRRQLENFSHYADQPFAVSSGLGILSVAEAARNSGIKVLLSGDCADENFGGYSWYPYLAEINSSAKTARDENAWPVSFQNFGMPLKERLKIMSGYSSPKKAWALHYYADESEKAAIFNPELFKGIGSSLRHFSEFNPKPDWRPEDFIKHDREFYLTNEMLQKLDRMTMAHSVEGRVPFAAPAVMAHVEKLGFNHLVRNGTLKWALREAFADILPEEISKRPKHGFNVPIDRWLKEEWADLFEETFSPNSMLAKEGLINKNSREVAYKMLHDKNRLNGHTIFCFIMLNLWLNQQKRR